MVFHVRSLMLATTLVARLGEEDRLALGTRHCPGGVIASRIHAIERFCHMFLAHGGEFYAYSPQAFLREVVS